MAQPEDQERWLALGELAAAARGGPAAAEEIGPSGVQTGALAGLPVEEARLFFAAAVAAWQPESAHPPGASSWGSGPARRR